MGEGEEGDEKSRRCRPPSDEPCEGSPGWGNVALAGNFTAGWRLCVERFLARGGAEPPRGANLAGVGVRDSFSFARTVVHQVIKS